MKLDVKNEGASIAQPQEAHGPLQQLLFPFPLTSSLPHKFNWGRCSSASSPLQGASPGASEAARIRIPLSERKYKQKQTSFSSQSSSLHLFREPGVVLLASAGDASSCEIWLVDSGDSSPELDTSMSEPAWSRFGGAEDLVRIGKPARTRIVVKMMHISGWQKELDVECNKNKYKRLSDLWSCNRCKEWKLLVKIFFLKGLSGREAVRGLEVGETKFSATLTWKKRERLTGIFTGYFGTDVSLHRQLSDRSGPSFLRLNLVAWTCYEQEPLKSETSSWRASSAAPVSQSTGASDQYEPRPETRKTEQPLWCSPANKRQQRASRTFLKSFSTNSLAESISPRCRRAETIEGFLTQPF